MPKESGLDEELTRLIGQILAELREFKQPCPTPATPEALSNTVLSLSLAFDAELPAEYEAFLRQVNGLDYDSMVWYAAQASGSEAGEIQDLLDANNGWHEQEGEEIISEPLESQSDRGNRLFLGSDGISLYSTDLAGHDPRREDPVAGDVLEHYGSVTEMLVSALRERLGEP